MIKSTYTYTVEVTTNDDDYPISLSKAIEYNNRRGVALASIVDALRNNTGELTIQVDYE